MGIRAYRQIDMHVARRGNGKRPYMMLLATVTYSMVLSLAIMSYVYYHDWQVVSYPSSPFQKGIHRWKYSSLSRNFFHDLKNAVGLADAITARSGIRYNTEHSGYRDMQYQTLTLSCSRCAIISSSGHLINTSAGHEIDSTPCVFRMNNAPVIGFEKDVGSRTTVRSMGHVNLIKSFEKHSAVRKEMLANNRTRAEIILINWMNTVHVDVYSDQEYRFALLLAHLHPDVKFFAFTPEQMNATQELFKNETGFYSSEANTWLSTGWFTMVAAMDICQEIVVYGMADDHFCQNATKDQVVEDIPYHYYEPDKLKECQYYNKSETRLTGGHLFITEKAVFANWAVQNKKITFRYPSWPIKNQTVDLDTPFFNKFWAFIKEGGNMTALREKKPKSKKNRRRRRRRKKKVEKDMVITLQRGNESIRVHQNDLIETLAELLPDIKVIQNEDYLDTETDKNGNSSSSKTLDLKYNGLVNELQVAHDSDMNPLLKNPYLNSDKQVAKPKNETKNERDDHHRLL